MSTRAYVANMESLDTQQFNGFPRDRSNPRSKIAILNISEDVISLQDIFSRKLVVYYIIYKHDFTISYIDMKVNVQQKLLLSL